MLVHWFKKAHFSQKPLFLTKFDLYSWNLWIILIYKDTSSAQIYYGQNMKCYQNDNLLRVNVMHDSRIMHTFVKNKFRKNVEFNN